MKHITTNNPCSILELGPETQHLFAVAHAVSVSLAFIIHPVFSFQGLVNVFIKKNAMAVKFETKVILFFFFPSSLFKGRQMCHDSSEEYMNQLEHLRWNFFCENS